jgi:hypothetical protein
MESTAQLYVIIKRSRAYHGGLGYQGYEPVEEAQARADAEYQGLENPIGFEAVAYYPKPVISSHAQYWQVREARNEARERFEMAHDYPSAERIRRDEIIPRDWLLMAYEARYPELRNQPC